MVFSTAEGSADWIWDWDWDWVTLGSPKGHAWVTQASRLGAPWVDWRKLFVFNAAEKRPGGSLAEERRQRAVAHGSAPIAEIADIGKPTAGAVVPHDFRPNCTTTDCRILLTARRTNGKVRDSLQSEKNSQWMVFENLAASN